MDRERCDNEPDEEFWSEFGHDVDGYNPMIDNSPKSLAIKKKKQKKQKKQKKSKNSPSPSKGLLKKKDGVKTPSPKKSVTFCHKEWYGATDCADEVVPDPGNAGSPVRVTDAKNGNVTVESRPRDSQPDAQAE